MNIRWNSLITNIVASAALWGGALLSGLVLGSENAVSILAGMAALGGSAAIWIVWALSALETSQAEQAQQVQEKAKRSTANGDARLSLLLQLMSEDERQDLQRRLVDELGSDGENISLAELLAAKSLRREK